MSHGTRPRNRRTTPRWLVALLAMLLAVPLAVATAGPASAHTKLVSSNPADGAALDAPPQQVVLTFNEQPKSVTSVRAQETDGPLVALGDPVLDGTTVRVSWPQDQAAGLFRLVYVLVSDDGDPVEGTLLFSYTNGTASAASATPAPASSVPASPSAVAVDTDSTMGRAWLVGVGLVLLAAVAVLVLSRRRRHVHGLTTVGSAAPRESESSVV